jgi:hypothetical protein
MQGTLENVVEGFGARYVNTKMSLKLWDLRAGVDKKSSWARVEHVR